jgi:hypothetical protein
VSYGGSSIMAVMVRLPRSRNVSCKNGEEEFQNLGIALTFVTMGIPHPMEQGISSPKHGAAAACSSGVPDRSNLRITAARPEITRFTSRFAPAATAASVGICEVGSVRNHRPRPPNGSYALPPQLPKRITKVLMVLTSQDQLGNTGRKTGFCLEQLAAPYEVRCTKCLRMQARRSPWPPPKGARPPRDPKSEDPTFQTDITRRFEKEAGPTA